MYQSYYSNLSEPIGSQSSNSFNRYNQYSSEYGNTRSQYKFNTVVSNSAYYPFQYSSSRSQVYNEPAQQWNPGYVNQANLFHFTDTPSSTKRTHEQASLDSNSDSSVNTSSNNNNSVEDEEEQPPRLKKLRKTIASNGLQCQVCNAESAGLHYGGLACTACKIFFK